MSAEVLCAARRINAAIAAELDVAWDQMHAAGWRDDQLCMISHDDGGGTSLAVRAGDHLVPVFRVGVAFELDTLGAMVVRVHVTGQWLMPVHPPVDQFLSGHRF